MHHWYPWQGSPREFVRAWRHVVDVFRAEGATNVKWVWAPIDPDKSFSRAYYPGSGYVDAVSTTVINFGELEYQDWMQWHSFESLFDKKYTALSRYGKPIILSETETNEGKPGQKAQWITDMFKAIAKGKYPKLTALIWFNVESDHMYPSINWSLSSSESATQAFREGVQLLKDMPAPKPTPSSSVHNSQPN
jgi:endoglucanase